MTTMDGVKVSPGDNVYIPYKGKIYKLKVDDDGYLATGATEYCLMNAAICLTYHSKHLANQNQF
jgi:hypothetical protein